MTEWQPMSEAPRDGTRILVVDIWDNMHVAYWCVDWDKEFWSTNQMAGIKLDPLKIEPVRWMHLPESAA